MTLHNTTEFAKKAGIAGSIFFGVVLILVIFFRVGAFVKDILFPPRIEPANQAYGKIPQLIFPESTVKGQFTYTIDTVNGSLPEDFPDRIIVYPMIINAPNLLNLETTKSKITTLGFVDDSGNSLPEIPRGGPNYEWDENTGLQRKIVYDIVTQNFIMSSSYLTSLTVLNAQNIGDEKTSISTVQSFLGSINSFPSDIDLTLTKSPPPDLTYVTGPQLYSISNGKLVRTTSLSSTQIIRVDLYQKEIDYTLTAGQNSNLAHFQDFELKLPILYPHPPYSTMNFLIASGQNDATVVSGIFNHQTINLLPDTKATYPIKTAAEAFADLKNGKGYVAAYNGTDNQILVNKVFLAYYLGDKQQQYLTPVIVFSGQNGFFAYVSAIKDEALQ